MKARLRMLLAAAALATTPSLAAAQQGCGTGPGAALCRQALDAGRLAVIRAGVVAAGGNPLTGTPSTLGMRVGAPRIGLAGRAGVTSAELPPLDASGIRDATLLYFGVDAAAGVFDGFSPAPTVGGVASIDLLLSVGRLALPDGAEFGGGTTTWAAGLRVGALRESFTLPGITLSAAYRRVGSVEQGAPDLSETEASATADGTSLWSVRAVVGKRIAALGLSAGLGHDRATADVHVRFRENAAIVERDFDGRHIGRTSAFANVAWTSLVYTVAGELGRQLGGSGAFFGGVALRITL